MIRISFPAELECDEASVVDDTDLEGLYIKISIGHRSQEGTEKEVFSRTHEDLSPCDYNRIHEMLMPEPDEPQGIDYTLQKLAKYIKKMFEADR